MKTIVAAILLVSSVSVLANDAKTCNEKFNQQVSSCDARLQICYNTTQYPIMCPRWHDDCVNSAKTTLDLCLIDAQN